MVVVVVVVVRQTDGQPSLLVYAALGVPPLRSVKLRKRRASCPACGTEEGRKVGKIEDVDYVQFCGGARPDWEALGLKTGDGESRITASVRLFLLFPLGQNSLKDGMLMVLRDTRRCSGASWNRSRLGSWMFDQKQNLGSVISPRPFVRVADSRPAQRL